MRFAYLTRDEVNQDLALTFAAEHGVQLEVHARGDALDGREYDAVLCDFDSFPSEEREANLVTLLACPKNKPFAVHTYNLDNGQLQDLRRNGALTVKSLRGELFGRLLAAIREKTWTQTVA
jgi:hypothetical protein